MLGLLTEAGRRQTNKKDKIKEGEKEGQRDEKSILKILCSGAFLVVQ